MGVFLIATIGTAELWSSCLYLILFNCKFQPFNSYNPEEVPPVIEKTSIADIAGSLVQYQRIRTPLLTSYQFAN